MNCCVVGLQWGDEGKGKVVDILAEETDMVVRYGGGANAGHTIVVDGEKFIYAHSQGKSLDQIIFFQDRGFDQITFLCDKLPSYVSQFALTRFRREKKKFHNDEFELLVLYGRVALVDNPK